MCTFQFSANYDMSTLPTCFISRTVVLHLQQGRVTGSRSLFYLFLTTWQWDFSLKALPTALLMGKQEKHSFRQFKVKNYWKEAICLWVIFWISQYLPWFAYIQATIFSYVKNSWELLHWCYPQIIKMRLKWQPVYTTEVENSKWM